MLQSECSTIYNVKQIKKKNFNKTRGKTLKIVAISIGLITFAILYYYIVLSWARCRCIKKNRFIIYSHGKVVNQCSVTINTSFQIYSFMWFIAHSRLPLLCMLCKLEFFFMFCCYFLASLCKCVVHVLYTQRYSNKNQVSLKFVFFCYFGWSDKKF